MLVDPRPSLRARARRWLGTDTLPRTNRKLDALEASVSTVIDALRELTEQQRAASAAQLTSFSNLHNAITRLEEAVKSGEASPEVKAAVDDLKRGFETMRDDANRADDGYEPASTGPVEDGGDVIAAPEQPVDEQPTAEVSAETDTTARKSR